MIKVSIAVVFLTLPAKPKKLVKEDIQDVQVKQFLAMMNNDLSVIVEDDDASVRETAHENLSQKNPSSLIGRKS